MFSEEPFEGLEILRDFKRILSYLFHIYSTRFDQLEQEGYSDDLLLSSFQKERIFLRPSIDWSWFRYTLIYHVIFHGWASVFVKLFIQLNCSKTWSLLVFPQTTKHNNPVLGSPSFCFISWIFFFEKGLGRWRLLQYSEAWANFLYALFLQYVQNIDMIKMFRILIKLLCICCNRCFRNSECQYLHLQGTAKCHLRF